MGPRQQAEATRLFLFFWIVLQVLAVKPPKIPQADSDSGVDLVHADTACAAYGAITGSKTSLCLSRVRYFQVTGSLYCSGIW